MSISLYIFGLRKIQKYNKLSNNINFIDERIIKIIINEFDIERLDYKLPKNLSILDLSKNKLKSLPRIPELIEIINCSFNSLQYFGCKEFINYKCLKEIDCSNNYISIIITLPINLEILKCQNNNLYELPKLPKKLKKLNCSNNNLKTLGEEFHSLDELVEIDCSFNKITRINELPKKLKILNCYHNMINYLGVINDRLEELCCHDNKLSELPNLHQFLRKVWIHNNKFDKYNFHSIFHLNFDKIDLKI